MKFIITIFILSASLNLYSQHQADNWYFGNHAGVNFSTGNPVVLTDGQINSDEGAASISDSIGNLLFYTDGVTVYNRQHLIMQNGDSLFGNNNSTQSAIIVPQPGNDSVYYIFTVNDTPRSRGLCYSIANIKANNGLGNIIAKNIPLLIPVSEKVTAIMHCNQKDIWVITREYASDKYYSWLVTATGIILTPVISPTGNIIGSPTTGFVRMGDAAGYLKGSPDGKKIISFYHDGVGFNELSEFNNATGSVYNTIKINSRPPLTNSAPGKFYSYAGEFSPDSKQLYICSGIQYNPTNQFNVIGQLDIRIHDSALIAQSYYFVDSNSSYGRGSFQLANNFKIYSTSLGNPYLDVINKPNLHGANCNYQSFVVVFPNPITAEFGLPTFIQSYFNPALHGIDFYYTDNCSSLTTNFFLNSTSYVDSVKWNFGDSPSGVSNTVMAISPTHQFSNNGNYTITSMVYKHTPCSFSIDTIMKNIWVGALKVNLGADTSICTNDTIQLHATIPGVANLWSNNSTDTFIKASQPGLYWVRLTKNTCVATDTIRILNKPLPFFSLGGNIVKCIGATTPITATPSYPTASYLWSNNATSPSITVSATGIYWLQITDSLGCKWRNIVSVSNKQLPGFNLGADTAICESDSLFVTAPLNNTSTYTWNTGAATPSIKLTQPGIYWCNVTKDGCTYRDSIQLTLNPRPVVNIGNDTTLCEGNRLQLNAGNTGATYLWQDNSTAANYLVTKEGLYNVSVNKSNCIAKDTIYIFYALKPRFTLGVNQFICQGQSIVLQPAINPQWILQWQDGSSQPTYKITQSGVYSLNASNDCGSTSEQVLFTNGPCQIYIPNAFAPNGPSPNNLFRVKGMELVTNFHLQIFNRYGQLVFETTDKNRGWDGALNNKPAEKGNYVYVLQYKQSNSAQMQYAKGNCLLIR